MILGRLTDRFRRAFERSTERRSHRLVADPLELRAERRIGRQVICACRIRVREPIGTCVEVLALSADGILWWLPFDPWRRRAGPVICWRSLADGVLYTRPRRVGSGWVFEFSHPPTGELFLGTLLEPGAKRMAGHLAASQFAALTVGSER